MKAVRIKAIGGDEPHESWGGWRGFLKSCEVRDNHDGVVFYGKTNCNYIVFPDGTLLQNYGYHGWGLMNEVREKGAATVLAGLRKERAEMDALIAKVRSWSRKKG